MPVLKHLFQPIKIGPLELPNRIIWPAVTTFYDYNYDLKGEERSDTFYAEIARGGASLLIIGALQALYPGRRDPPRVAINDDKWIPHLKLWAKAIHDGGAKCAAQLAVWNQWAPGGEGTPAVDFSPSGVVTWEGPSVRESPYAMFDPETTPLTVEQIHAIEELVGIAAVRAVEAGFDAVELPAVAGNLLSRFMTPHTNRRTDEYGGSAENRTRMLTETVAAIKRRVGNDFPLIVRFPGTDMLPYGLDLAGFKELAPFVEKAGAHAIDIMPGWYESTEPKPHMCVPRGAFLYLSEGIKQAVKIPVIANIRINDPVMADRAIAEGKADAVAMCRPLIADPELPRKAREGRLGEIRFCTACCSCYDDIIPKHALRCSVNARAGKETVLNIIPAEKPKKVLIIGGGPAGMEAARVASLRGHQVTLYEKDKLGGQLVYAVMPPYKEEWQTLTDYLTGQMRRLKVKVVRREATARTIARLDPDAVIVATGAVPLVPGIPGIDGPNVAVSLDVLAGRSETGRNVVIVGGGLIGCETAEYLHQRRRQVTILEMLPQVGADIGPANARIVLARIAKSGIRTQANTKVTAITGSGVKTISNGAEKEYPADTVVIAAGMKSDSRLAKELEGKVANLQVIGACMEPRRVKQAIEEGFIAGTKV